MFQGVSAAMALEIAEQVLLKAWGEKIKEYAKPLYVKHRIMAIACISSVIAQEIRFREAEIIKEINEKLGQEAVVKLRYLD
jgi:predicted nucleic acid-binding Zn ribbon protein